MNKEVIKFRKARGNELRIAARVLERVLGRTVKTTPILTAAKFLENDASVNDLWGYEINDLILPVETLKHIRPQGIKQAELVLNMKLGANFGDWGTLNDPLKELNFKIRIRGVGARNHFFGFHLDKHDFKKDSAEPHPIYHIQYNANPERLPDFEYGSFLHIDTPRIMHYPLDFILGIGFIFSNFSPGKYDKLFNDDFFSKVYKEYQRCIWKPYAHTLANYWSPFDKDGIVWNPISHLCPFIYDDKSY